LDDVIVSLDSWVYLIDFMVFQPKNSSGDHPLILGRPWLAIANAFIGCRSINMFISHRISIRKVTLYPPTKSSHELENTPWIDTTNSDEEKVQSISTIDHIMQFKVLTEEDQIQSFLVNLECLQNFDLSFDRIFSSYF
jgi:hypothetical protein